MKIKINKFVGALITFVVLIALGYIIPVTLTLGNEEIANEEITFFIFLFSGFLAIGLLGTFILYFGFSLWKSNNKFTDSFGFYNIGSVIPYWKRFTSLQLVFASIIIFSSIFLLANTLNFSGFTGLRVLPQQFSPVESLLFSSLLVPIAEESLSIFVTGVLVLTLTFISLKYGFKKKDFLTAYFAGIPLVVGLLAIAWHGSAYSNSDVALTVVFAFWFIKTMIVLAIGFIAIPVIMHMLNNFFIDFSRLYTNDTLLLVMLGIIISMLVLYVIIYRGRVFGGRINQ